MRPPPTDFQRRPLSHRPRRVLRDASTDTREGHDNDLRRRVWAKDSTHGPSRRNEARRNAIDEAPEGRCR